MPKVKKFQIYYPNILPIYPQQLTMKEMDTSHENNERKEI